MCRSSVEKPRTDRIEVLGAMRNLPLVDKRSIPKKVIQVGMVSVAGLLICTGFGIMSVVKGVSQK